MTLYVNLIGGPGTGKSTNAAGVFYKLKSAGVDCEYIQEYAKDKTWQEAAFVLGCQPYISAKQLFRQHQVLNKVEVAITDACLLNGLVYDGHYTGPAFEQWLLDTFNSFDNLNIFLKRNLANHPYNPNGRSQTLEESQNLDIQIEAMLHKYKQPYVTIDVTPNTADDIVKEIRRVCPNMFQETLSATN